MRQVILFSITVVLLFSCFLITPQPTKIDEIDMDAISTAAYQTALAEINNDQTMTANVWTATYTPTLFPTPIPSPTPMPSLTPSPFPAKIKTLLQGKCDVPWQHEGTAWGIRAPDIFKKYGGKGCRLPIFSPNGKHLAYVTAERPKSQDILYVETIRVLQIVTGKTQSVYFAHDTSYIDNLEWSPTGHLIIQEQTWEGPLFILIYDPASNSIVTTMRLDYRSKLGWNTAHTALYAKHSHEYGASTCIHELRGYDFAYGNPFPDFYEIFGIEKEAEGLLGIPNGKSDDIAVEPFAWSGDGSQLWITITLLHKGEDGSYYEVGPKQAGVLELERDKVKFTMLASDPKFDYSFDETPRTTIVATPYQPRRCP